MEKLNRWVAKNAWLVYVTFGVSVVSIIFLWDDILKGPMPILLEVLLLTSIWLCARWVFTRGSVLLKKPLEILTQNCDPYPYLEEAEIQRSYSGNWNVKLGHITTLATALSEVGEYGQMEELLTATPEETVRRAHPVNQVVYCGLVASIYARQKNTQELELWHDKLLSAYQKVKLRKHKAWLEATMVSYHVVYHYARQEYTQGLQLLENFPAQPLRNKVVQAYALAKFRLALNEKEKAAEHLEFVVRNGNKLYIVTEAKALLEKINTEE